MYCISKKRLWGSVEKWNFSSDLGWKNNHLYSGAIKLLWNTDWQATIFLTSCVKATYKLRETSGKQSFPKLATTSHRAQICTFGCYIVCALLFQRFLVNDHHVGAHRRLKALQWGRENLTAILATSAVRAGWVRVSLRQQPSRNVLQSCADTKMSTGLEFSAFLTFWWPCKQRTIQVGLGGGSQTCGGWTDNLMFPEGDSQLSK